MSKVMLLSTKHGYPLTFITSPSIDVLGFDAFVSVDFSKPDAAPVVNLVGVTVSAHRQEPKSKFHRGDRVFIGDKTYELVCTKEKYIGNGDVTLVEVIK